MYGFMFPPAPQASTSEPDTEPRAREDARLRAWRLERYRKDLRFSRKTSELFLEAGIDWREAKKLRDVGCPVLTIFMLLKED